MTLMSTIHNMYWTDTFRSAAYHRCPMLTHTSVTTECIGLLSLTEQLTLTLHTSQVLKWPIKIIKLKLYFDIQSISYKILSLTLQYRTS
jgi:hypothetical protein